MSNDAVEDTMNLIRRLATHLAAEPNFPDVRELTRGEVDAWIRALNTGIKPRSVDFLSVSVLEILLHRQHLGTWDNPSCLARAPISNFNPVIVNAWDPDDTLYIAGDGEGGNSASIGSVADDLGTINIGDDNSRDGREDESMDDVNPEGNTDITMGEPTDEEIVEQNISDDGGSESDDTEKEITVHGSAEEAYIALQTPERNTTRIESDQNETDGGGDDDLNEESTIQEPEDPTEITMQAEPEPHAPDNVDSPPTAEQSDDEDPDRELWCHCNMPQDDRAMVECENHKDPDCKGKWYHTSCAGLLRIPPAKSEWYCRDCRKKLSRGLYTNGIVG